MKILHVLDLSLPDLSGYSIRAKGIVEAQKSIGLFPVCLTSFRQSAYCDDREVFNDIVYYRSGKFNPRINLPFVRQFSEMNMLSEKVASVAKEENVDIIHAHSPILCGMAAVKAGRKRSLPVVYEIRAFWEDAAVSSGKCREGDLRYRTTRGLETLVCKRADKVVAICEGIRNDLLTRNISPGKIEIVPNGITLNEFAVHSKSETLLRNHKLEGCLILGFIGSFFKFEGVDMLVHLMKELRNEPVKMVLVGEGETFDAVKGLIREFKLNDRIVLTGRVPHNKIQEYYSIIDVLIYPRYSQRITELTTPLKPLEAMAMEKQVIISSVEGLKELVPQGCGVTFIAGDVLDLRDKVRGIMENPDLREKTIKNANAFLKSRDWVQVVKKYINIYEGLFSQ